MAVEVTTVKGETMDDIDRAQEREQFDRDMSIRCQQEHMRWLDPDGACHFCAATVADGARFCDKDCLDDWQREQDARRIRGRR